MPAKKKNKKVLLDLEAGHKQTLLVKPDFKIHDVLIEVDNPGAWVIIPTVTGGFFCMRSGLITAIAVEDEDAV